MDIELITIIGPNIRTARKLINMSQKQLASACGLEQSFISQLENGNRGLNLGTLSAISKAVNCPVEDLVSRNMASKSTLRNELSRLIDRLPEDKISVVFHFAMKEYNQLLAQYPDLDDESLINAADPKDDGYEPE